jgi:hypothetical protein
MVAREEAPGDAARTNGRRSRRLVAGMFLAWRRWLTAAADGLGAVARRAVAVRELGPAAFRAWRALLAALAPSAGASAGAVRRAARTAAGALAASGRFLLEPSAPLAEEDARRVATVGLVALGIGAAGTLAVARPLGTPLGTAVVAAAWMLVWAPIRLAVLRLARPEVDRTRLTRAWSAALLPSLAGVTALLAAAALVASAWLTYAALRGAGTARHEAATAVGWAFGAQMAAEVTRWLAEGALFYVLFLRSRG